MTGESGSPEDVRKAASSQKLSDTESVPVTVTWTLTPATVETLLNSTIARLLRIVKPETLIQFYLL